VSQETDPVERLGPSPNAAALRDEAPPQRGPLLLACLVLVVVPTVALLVACVYVAFWLIFAGSHAQTSPMNLLAAIVFPVPLLLVLLFEYQAVVKRSPVAALLLGALFLFPVFPGTAALAEELRGLFGQDTSPADGWQGTRVAAVVICVTFSALVSLAHLSWWRRLMRWQCESAADEADP
jgi:hypothetical protein